MAWFALDIYSVLRFCGASALLLGVYYLLYDRKARFLHCRYYLLSLVLIAALVSVVRIPVYESGHEVILSSEQPAGLVADHIEVQSQEIQTQTIIPELNRVEVVEAEEEIDTGEKHGIWEHWQPVSVAFLIYGVVTLLFLIRWLIAMLGIIQLKKWGSSYCLEDILVIRNNRVASPFSFFRMIFINRKLQGETLQVVISHEKSHIEHKHYRDTLLIELFCIFFWFNPFVWLVKRELKALHEFEVDRSLLNNGLELSKYQNIIFNELMGYGPAIANGFHNSMIKKRFIMMKTVNNVRYCLLRRMMLLPAIAGVMVIFAFTDKETVKEHVWLPFMTDVHTLEAPVANIVLTDEESVLPVGQVDLALITPEIVQSSVSSDTVMEEQLIIISDTTTKVKSPFKGREGFTFYPLQEDQVVVSLLPFVSEEQVKYVEIDKNETRVTIAVPVYFESNWVQFSKGFCIVDKDSGDTYMIRSMTRGIELNKTYVVEGKLNRMVEFTMVFPPLKQDVKVVNMYQKYPELGVPMPSNGSSSCFKNLKIVDYQPPKDIELYYDKEGRPRQDRKVEYVDLREDQMVVSDMPFENKTRIKSIVSDRQETRLTIVVPIFHDRHWIQFSKGFCIEDCRNGDAYKVHSLDRGIEFNKTLVVSGKRGKMIEFTMVFPRLKKKVKKVNIYAKYPEESGLAPTNANGEWNWRQVRLSKYDGSSGQIYY